MRRLVDNLYSLEPELVEPDYRRAFAETLSRFRRRALIVVLTDLAVESTRLELLADLPMIARSHLVLVGAVRDPAISKWASQAPTDAGTSYRQAAAIATLDARKAMINSINSTGAQVVDAEPGQLGPLITDAYLNAKARGKL